MCILNIKFWVYSTYFFAIKQSYLTIYLGSIINFFQVQWLFPTKSSVFDSLWGFIEFHSLRGVKVSWKIWSGKLRKKSLEGIKFLEGIFFVGNHHCIEFTRKQKFLIPLFCEFFPRFVTPRMQFFRYMFFVYFSFNISGFLVFCQLINSSTAGRF